MGLRGGPSPCCVPGDVRALTIPLSRTSTPALAAAGYRPHPVRTGAHRAAGDTCHPVRPGLPLDTQAAQFLIPEETEAPTRRALCQVTLPGPRSTGSTGVPLVNELSVPRRPAPGPGASPRPCHLHGQRSLDRLPTHSGWIWFLPRIFPNFFHLCSTSQ